MFLDLDNDTVLIKILKPCIFGLALSLCTRALTVLENGWVGGVGWFFSDYRVSPNFLLCFGWVVVEVGLGCDN